MVKTFVQKNKGFTLVELIVVVSIISGITLLVVFNNQSFNNDLALQTASSEVSLAIRQAQSFGISARQANINSVDFGKSYGIVFDLQNPKNFFIYSDTDGDRAYDGGTTCPGTDECREKSVLQSGVTIRRICAEYLVNSTQTCFSGGARYLTLTYVRPNPEPIIKVFNASNVEMTGPWKTAYVELVSTNGTLSYVVTDSISGQIVIQRTPVIP